MLRIARVVDTFLHPRVEPDKHTVFSDYYHRFSSGEKFDKNDIREFRKAIKALRERIIRLVNMIVITLFNTGVTAIFQNFEPQLAILDEAARTVEPVHAVQVTVWQVDCGVSINPNLIQAVADLIRAKSAPRTDGEEGMDTREGLGEVVREDELVRGVELKVYIFNNSTTQTGRWFGRFPRRQKWRGKHLVVDGHGRLITQEGARCLVCRADTHSAWDCTRLPVGERLVPTFHAAILLKNHSPLYLKKSTR